MLQKMSCELKLASSIKIKLVKANREKDVKEIFPGNSTKFQSAKRSTDTSRKRKTTLSIEEIKRVKEEWGKAYKHMFEGKDPIFPVFMRLTQTPMCSNDPYFLKMFREMSYGVFPRGIFYDRNRNTIICSAGAGKKMSIKRQQRINRFIGACLPGRPASDYITSELTSHTDTDCDVQSQADDSRERKILRYIHRSHYRLELSLADLVDKYRVTEGRLFQEIKLFMFVIMDLISPSDEQILQDISTTAANMIIQAQQENSQEISWKKMNETCRMSLIGLWSHNLYKESCLNGRTNYNPSRASAIGSYLASLYKCGSITNEMISFRNGMIESIEGYTVTHTGVGRTKRPKKPVQMSELQLHEVVPLVIYQHSVVDIGKIDKIMKRKADKLNSTIYNMNEDSDVEPDIDDDEEL